MARKIVWTAAALSHFEEVWRHISAVSTAPILRQIVDAIEWRIDYPEMGLVNTLIDDRLWEFELDGWRVMYYVHETRIDVICICRTRHGWVK